MTEINTFCYLNPRMDFGRRGLAYQNHCSFWLLVLNYYFLYKQLSMHSIFRIPTCVISTFCRSWCLDSKDWFPPPTPCWFFLLHSRWILNVARKNPFHAPADVHETVTNNLFYAVQACTEVTAKTSFGSLETELL